MTFFFDGNSIPRLATHRATGQTAHSGVRSRLGCGNVAAQPELHVEVAQSGTLKQAHD